MKPTRQIKLLLEIDREDYEDVDDQLIIEDAIRETADGVRIAILNDEQETTKKHGRNRKRTGIAG